MNAAPGPSPSTLAPSKLPAPSTPIWKNISSALKPSAGTNCSKLAPKPTPALTARSALKVRTTSCRTGMCCISGTVGKAVLEPVPRSRFSRSQCSDVTDFSQIGEQHLLRGGFTMGQSYRELIAWQKAMDFVMDVYRTTSEFPRDELYGLATQLRRAVVSVPANIAEGQARYSPGEFFHFLGRARGSLVETETHLLIAQNLGYITR